MEQAGATSSCINHVPHLDRFCRVSLHEFLGAAQETRCNLSRITQQLFGMAVGQRKQCPKQQVVDGDTEQFARGKRFSRFLIAIQRALTSVVPERQTPS